MEVSCAKVGEALNDRHDVNFDDFPTNLEEFPIEAIRVQGLVGRHLQNSLFDLILGERVI
jgi:hypothetical protein